MWPSNSGQVTAAGYFWRFSSIPFSIISDRRSNTKPLDYDPLLREVSQVLAPFLLFPLAVAGRLQHKTGNTVP